MIMEVKSKIYGQQAEEPRELIAQLHSEIKGIRTRKANGVSSSPSLTAGEDQYPSPKTVKQGEKNSFLLRLLFYSGLQQMG